MSKEQVNHPEHYNSDPSGIECIEKVRQMNFNVGNAVKYLWRNGLKDGNSNIQDLKKAIWYLNDEISRINSKEEVKKINSLDVAKHRNFLIGKALSLIWDKSDRNTLTKNYNEAISLIEEEIKELEK